MIKTKLKDIKIFYSQYIPKNINKLKNKKLFTLLELEIRAVFSTNKG